MIAAEGVKVFRFAFRFGANFDRNETVLWRSNVSKIDFRFVPFSKFLD